MSPYTVFITSITMSFLRICCAFSRFKPSSSIVERVRLRANDRGRSVCLQGPISKTPTRNRLFSTQVLVAAMVDSQKNNLIHPNDIGDGSIPYPKALSPSAIMEFKKCPQSFLFQYLYNMKQPTSLALAKGSMCHSALEQVFDLDPEDRTLSVLQDLYRAEWAQHRKSDTYRILFETGVNGEWDIDAEREWGKEALQLLENYYYLEDPKAVARPNPVKREIWLNAHLSVDPNLGASASKNRGGVQSNEAKTGDENIDIPTFHVRGIVDRLDMIKTTDSPSKVSLRIVDYKTGML